MLIARVFIKNTDVALDVPLTATLGQLMYAVRTDGFLVHDSFYIPYSEIKYVVTYEAEAPGKVLHLVPSPEKPA